jgi:hypothetical protein
MGRGMAFEYPTVTGVVELINDGERWRVRYADRESGGWQSADDAARAVASHKTGLAKWDRKRQLVPADLLEWRPTGDSI